MQAYPLRRLKALYYRTLETMARDCKRCFLSVSGLIPSQTSLFAVRSSPEVVLPRIVLIQLSRNEYDAPHTRIHLFPAFLVNMHAFKPYELRRINYIYHLTRNYDASSICILIIILSCSKLFTAFAAVIQPI